MENTIYAVLGRRVREERRAAKLTLEDMAHRAQISSSFLSYIESGRRKASLGTVEKLARALGLDPGDLLTSKEQAAADPAAQAARQFSSLVRNCDAGQTRAILDVARAAAGAIRRR